MSDLLSLYTNRCARTGSKLVILCERGRLYRCRRAADAENWRRYRRQISYRKASLLAVAVPPAPNTEKGALFQCARYKSSQSDYRPFSWSPAPAILSPAEVSASAHPPCRSGSHRRCR